MLADLLVSDWSVAAWAGVLVLLHHLQYLYLFPARAAAIL
jgi:hypothetical protein